MYFYFYIVIFQRTDIYSRLSSLQWFSECQWFLFFFFFSSQEDYSIGLTVIALKAPMIHVWQITLLLPWITNDLIQLFVFEVLGNVGRMFHQKNEIKHFQVFHSFEREIISQLSEGFFFFFFFFHLFVIFKAILLRLLIVLILLSQLKMFLPCNSGSFFFRQREILNEDILCILNMILFCFISSIIDLFLNFKSSW